MRKSAKRKQANVIWLPIRAHRRTAAAAVHDQEVVGGKLLAFPPRGGNEVGPVLLRDSAALAPLLDPLGTGSDITGHLGDGVPPVENFDDLHAPLIPRDQLSRNGLAIVPVTESGAPRTISRMGRARTPVKFNKDLALRLKSARVAAGYQTMPPFAKALGIETARYKKWESGRTPFQHEYLASICELTGKDANYFYDIQAKELRRTG